MPIVFIFSGLLILLIIFDYYSKFGRRDDIVLSFVCLNIMCSYFGGDLFVGRVTFNLFQLIAFALIVIGLAKYLSLRILMLSICSALVYKLCLNVSLNIIVSFDKNFVFGLVLIFSLLYLGRLASGVCFVSVASALISILSAFACFDNFGFLKIDLTFLFELVIMFFLINFIYKLVSNKFSFGRSISNVKKEYFGLFDFDSVFVRMF